MLRHSLRVGIMGAMAVFPAIAQMDRDVPLGSCMPTVEQELTRLQVNRADLSRTILSPEYSIRDDDNQRLIGHKAWVEYKSCRGYLIIDMGADCGIRQVYTRGECRVPGVRAF